MDKQQLHEFHELNIEEEAEDTCGGQDREISRKARRSRIKGGGISIWHIELYFVPDFCRQVPVDVLNFLWLIDVDSVAGYVKRVVQDDLDSAWIDNNNGVSCS